MVRSLAPSKQWPQAPAVYQIYPRSFLDTTGNGIGDLNGITSKLDVIADLGVDAVWLSPVYLSPFVDGGYDITDHCKIDPRFGTMDDFDALVSKAHDLGLRVIMDQVLNHTSDQNPHFQASIEGDETAAARYVWRDPKPDGTAPNNWLTQFGQQAWTWNHKRRQYYMHQFLKEQPSLDLRCEAVQETHREELQFWQARGVDGFRFDVVTAFLFDPSMKDNPPASAELQDKVSGDNFVPYTYQDHQYDILPGDGAAYMEKLREWVGPDAWLIGESTAGNDSLSLAMDFTSDGRLDGCYTTDFPEGKADADTLQRIFDTGTDLQRLPGWLSSHDQPRHLEDADMGRFYALLMAAIPGPWLIYQGEELGLLQPKLSKDDVTDPLDLLYWPDGPGREGARVPLPWQAEAENAGFSSGKPWLPMDWPPQNARDQNASDGLPAFYRKVLQLRQSHAWNTATVPAYVRDGDLLSMTLQTTSETFIVDVNYGDMPVDSRSGAPLIASGEVGKTLPARTVAVYAA